MENSGFILGVGAQKAATSWLFSYLSEHPDCRMGHIKEKAVFNNTLRPEIFKNGQIAKMTRLIQVLQDTKKKMTPGEPIPNPERLLDFLDNMAMNLDSERYWRHFSELRDQNPQAKLFGDITPEYAGLKAEDFAEIRGRLIALNFKPKVVFLMRDPIERCFSMFRMSDRNKKNRGRKIEQPAHIRMGFAAREPWCEIYTRYERTIHALESAFPAEEIFYGFYETFISNAEVAKCNEFLGIRPYSADLLHKANSSPREQNLSDATIASVRDFFNETYTFCANRFGQDFIETIWEHY